MHDLLALFNAFKRKQSNKRTFQMQVDLNSEAHKNRYLFCHSQLKHSSFLCQDADGLKVGVADLINQWVRGSEDGSRCSSPFKPAVCLNLTLNFQ